MCSTQTHENETHMSLDSFKSIETSPPFTRPVSAQKTSKDVSVSPASLHLLEQTQNNHITWSNFHSHERVSKRPNAEEYTTAAGETA